MTKLKTVLDRASFLFFGKKLEISSLKEDEDGNYVYTLKSKK
jgi:hypothetical protein